MNCQSCGMPMETPADHGGGNTANPYCVHCTDAAGNLKPREEVREGMINYYMQTMGKSREEAETVVDEHMAKQPAWQVPVSSEVSAQAQVPSPEPLEENKEESPLNNYSGMTQTPPMESSAPSELVSEPVSQTPSAGAAEEPSITPSADQAEDSAVGVNIPPATDTNSLTENLPQEAKNDTSDPAV